MFIQNTMYADKYLSNTVDPTQGQIKHFCQPKSIVSVSFVFLHKTYLWVPTCTREYPQHIFMEK